MSQLYKQSLTKFSFSTEVIAFSRNKLLGLCSEDNRMSLWGTNHILLYLKILRDIQEKKLSINQIITFANEGEQESKSLRSTNAQAGDKRLLIDVLNQAVSFNAPDCIKALWQVYGGKKNTQKILLELAEELNISKESQKSLTGRLVTGQKTNIFLY